jgi:hypothetical protein
LRKVAGKRQGSQLDTGVALMIFNRPEATARVFDVVAGIRPKRLFVIADGPREGVSEDEETCAATRAIVDRVDWDCEVLKNYSDVNLGVGDRPVTGLRWVFDHVEAAIILEDDCVPHPSFFRYCDELLEKYRDDPRVMHISGDNFRFGPRPSSYFFSEYCLSWGWATWRRAFQHYDPELRLWPALRNTSWLEEKLTDPRVVEFWASKFEWTYRAGVKVTGWDWPWLFACWAHRGLSILPSTNLISNIGFDEHATHTKFADDARGHVPAIEMNFPLTHPACMVRDTEVDQQILEQNGLPPEPQDLYYRVRRRCVDALPTPVRKSLVALRSSLSLSRQGAS